MIRRVAFTFSLALALFSVSALGPSSYASSPPQSPASGSPPRPEHPPSSFIPRGWLISSTVDLLSFAATNAPAWMPDTACNFLLEAAFGIVHTSDALTEKLGGDMPEIAVRPKSAGSFFSLMKRGINWKRWKMVGPYANGQPFKNGWIPELGYVSPKDRKLTLEVKLKPFFDYSLTGGGNGRRYPYSAAEIRTRDFYGIGCYSTCMKPSRVSGISSSFYAMSGSFDTPHDAGRYKNDIHSEVDIEFIGGKAPRMVQTNFFNRFKDPYANSASGNEQMHYLKFDATRRYSCYSWKWTRQFIAFYANGKPIRQVWAHKERIPSPSYSTMRISANTWPVNKQAEEWAGKLPKNLQHAEGKYAWFAFDKGQNCKTRKRC